jgi:hypothetical protein
VFIAGELLVVWEKREWRALLPLPRRPVQPELSRHSLNAKQI